MKVKYVQRIKRPNGAVDGRRHLPHFAERPHPSQDDDGVAQRRLYWATKKRNVQCDKREDRAYPPCWTGRLRLR